MSSEAYDPSVDYSLGVAHPDDEPALLALINRIQPHVPWSREQFAWQYWSPPAGHARLYVARHGGDIVAQYAAVPYEFQAAPRRTTAWMVQDVMTDPTHRGRGLLHHLGQRCLEDIRSRGDVGFTFPNEKSAGSFRRSGWRDLCRVPARQMSLAAVRATEASPLQPMEFSALSDSRLQLPVRSGVVRSARYLAWRYGKPKENYELFAAATGGFAVLKHYRDDGARVTHLCDLVTADSDAVEGTLRSCAAMARAAGSDTLTAWLTDGHPHAGFYEAVGLTFSEPARDVHVFYVAPLELEAEMQSASEWHLTQGDSDVY